MYQHMSGIHPHICRCVTDNHLRSGRDADAHRKTCSHSKHLDAGMSPTCVDDIPTHMSAIHLRIGRDADTHRKTCSHSKHLDAGMSPTCVDDIPTHMSAIHRQYTYVSEKMQTRIGRHADTPNTLMLECHRHVSMIYRHICR